MSNKFGSILFKPTCSNCGKVIHRDVKYRSSIDYDGIIPNACPYCGCYFETIKVPYATNSCHFTYSEDIYEIKKGDI